MSVVVLDPQACRSHPGPDRSGLRNHLGGLLERADETSDVSFSVGGETFPAHRAVLAARSPVFKAELFGSMAEAKMAFIKLEEIEPDTFRFLLRYVYTDALPGDEDLTGCSASVIEVFENLLAAADRYDVGGLKLACAQRLCEGLSVDTVVTTLVCAEMHGCPGLKKRCLDYITSSKKSFEKLAATEGYSQLKQLFPSVIIEIEDELKRREDRKRGALALDVGRRWFIKRTRYSLFQLFERYGRSSAFSTLICAPGHVRTTGEKRAGRFRSRSSKRSIRCRRYG